MPKLPPPPPREAHRRSALLRSSALDHPGTLLAGWDHHFDAHQVIAGQTHAAGEQADTRRPG